LNNRKNKIVAVVDDDPTMLKSMLRLLDACGFVARGYSSAEAFLAGESAIEASCLVLDINLDGMSGIELRRRLATSGYSLPVIFITAMNDEATEQEARSSGCVAYLRKPFGGKELIGAVAEAVS
jgi:FixJ family two-component response regulator